MLITKVLAYDVNTSQEDKLKVPKDNMFRGTCPLHQSQSPLESRHRSSWIEDRVQIEALLCTFMTDSSCPYLASAIRNNQTLRTLDLSDNNLEGPRFRDIMEALTTSWIEKLVLDNNSLTDISCHHMASGIRNNQTLRTLILSHNNLKGPHFRDLMEALTTSRIEELHLDRNRLTHRSCPHLASGIRNNQTLRTLHLTGNNLEGPYFRNLMEALTTSQIEELQLSANQLTDCSCPHLASGIRNNQTLRTLNLSINNLEGPHFRDLVEALTTSRVEKLKILGSSMSEEAKIELKNLEKLRPVLVVT
ncbi:ribonuclease inhibitor-like [Aquarana catesbeiana]|uniref:ribonuclease inhibitor-like n=1 Tax=Aquarana catesbeiana TaxID=8400 RepID=UPI003CC92CCB